MADKEQAKILRKGAHVWNDWRQSKPKRVKIDLSGVDVSGIDLKNVDLTYLDLMHASFRETDLSGSDLSGANLIGANFSKAILWEAKFIESILREANFADADLTAATLSDSDLTRANFARSRLSAAHFGHADLTGADLTGANLDVTRLSHTKLNGAILRGARLEETTISHVNLSEVIGLETCYHTGPSIIDFETLQISGQLPLDFQRGVGLPELLIEYLPSILNRPIQMYSCFISYSSKDQAFAERIYADLQSRGVRCWFAPHDLPIGAKTWDAIDGAIKFRDKLLLLLSRNAISSDWVEDEVNKAFAEERERKQLVLLPIRIDDSIMKTSEPWAKKLRDQRNIGDFRKWKNLESYQLSLGRLLRDLSIRKE